MTTKDIEGAIMAARKDPDVAAPFVAALQRLDECLYGTLVPRDPEENVRRPKHAPDGWRHGHSHPFVDASGREYDVREDNAANVKLHGQLKEAVVAQWELAALKAAQAPAAMGSEHEARLAYLKKGGIEVAL